jgi:hypothetical protein
MMMAMSDQLILINLQHDLYHHAGYQRVSDETVILSNTSSAPLGRQTDVTAPGLSYHILPTTPR